MTTPRIAAALACLAVLAVLGGAAAPRTADASPRCLPPSASGPLAAALHARDLPAGWKIGSVSLGARVARVSLAAPDGARLALKLAARDEGEGVGAFAVVSDGADGSGPPPDLIAAIQQAARAAVDDHWIPCASGEDAGADDPGLPAAGPPPVPSAPRWLALSIAFFRLALLVACLGLALFRSVRPARRDG